MQNSKPNSLLETNRNNYTPEASERHLVHYKVERIKYNPVTGVRQSHPELVMTDPKLFRMVKKDLEKQGYAVEIIYSPDGEYNTPVNVPAGSDSISRATYENVLAEAEQTLTEKEDQILALKEELERHKAEAASASEKDAEIAKLKAELKAAKARAGKAAKAEGAEQETEEQEK